MDIVTALRERQNGEALFDCQTGARIEPNRLKVDEQGVLRYAPSGRKVRRDYVARLDVALQAALQ